MCQIVRECANFLFAKGIGDICHRRHAATDSHVLLVVVQRLDRVFLALAGKTPPPSFPRMYRRGMTLSAVLRPPLHPSWINRDCRRVRKLSAASTRRNRRQQNSLRKVPSPIRTNL